MIVKYASLVFASVLAVNATAIQAQSTDTTSPSMDRQAPETSTPAAPATNGTWSTPEQDQNRNPRLDPPSSPSGDLENPSDSSKPLDGDVRKGMDNDSMD